ncbi:unnamed protein product [Allacma fusca]|uniref:Uncharacterized protein n=1 Tax=Allacma fusca TaxID=39272 RepID=A0A8J2LBZ5_9HEXA|nr:unnamed protein product [Allacma fusca]
MSNQGSELTHFLRKFATCNKGMFHWRISLVLLIVICGIAETFGATQISSPTDRGAPGRMNSRFLRTFPSMNNYYDNRKSNFARIDDYNEIPTHHFVNGNSPVFYIRLPPAPYILVPGLGYVSPHPYNSPMAMGMPGPVMGNPGNQGFDLSAEQSQKSVIALPLKFISNGRPAIIESPKLPPKNLESKGSTLISGGKYSFNGRPTAVFVVRSPA